MRNLLSMLICLILPVAAASQTIGIYADPDGESVCANIAMPVQDLYVVYTGGPDIEVIEFSALLPQCLTGVAIVDVSPYLFIGSSQTHVSIDLGGCVSPPVHVLTIQLFTGQLTETCCFYDLFDLQAFDCNDQPIAISTGGGGGWLSTEPCVLVTPFNPSPADGATSVPLDVDLEWEGGPPLPGCGLGDVLVHQLFFGTDPENLAGFFDVGSPFPRSNLSPGVTYYWQVEATTYNLGGPVRGPLWSFSTTGPVPAEKSTWGAVKALFD